MNKYFNTLKMMGASSIDALTFSDALETMHLTVNQEVKQKLRDSILNTVVMEKSFKEWFKFFVQEGNDCLVQKGELPISEEEVNLSLENIQKPQVTALLELVLQEYYEKNGFKL